MGCVVNALLNLPCQHTSPIARAIRHMGEIDIDLVDAAVFHDGCKFPDDGFEAAGIVAVALEVHG